jgi:hypothetical protein
MGTTTRADIALIALKANTASLALTASYFSGSITNAVSASYADTASYFSGSITNAVSASYALTASYFSGSITNAVSASYALSASTTLSASVTQNSNAGAQFPLVFVPNSDGITNLNTDSASLFYVPASNTLFATSSRAISASIADGAVASSTVRVVPDVTTNTFYPIPFASTAFGSAELYSDSSVINFNPSTNRLFITNISSSAITGSSFTGSFTGSLFGTASWANNVISASFAATASFFSGSISNAISASFAVTAGLAQRIEITDLSGAASAYEILFVDSTGSQIAYAELNNFYYVPAANRLVVDNIGDGSSPVAITGSLFGTSSWANNVRSASFASTSSFLNPGTYLITASWAQSASQAITASYVLQAISASFASTSSFLNPGTYLITASWAQSASQAISASRAITSSLALTAITASYVLNAVSASFASTSSFLNPGTYLITASWAQSASQAISASRAISASYAATASYAQNIVISGSISNADYIDFTTKYIIGTNEPAWKEGRVFYDSSSGALAVYNWEQDVTLNVGQESWLRARNQTGTLITNGTVVRLLGAIGDRPTVEPAQAIDQTNTFSLNNEIIGMATHDIEHGTDGFITTFGIVNGVNTAAFSAGDLLWVSQSAGQFTSVPPAPPFDKIFVGIVTRANPSNGSIFMTPLTSIHFHDISSVSASAYQMGDLWMYRSGSVGQANAWINTKQLTGSYAISGGLNVNGAITSSLFGTSSWAVSASQAITSLTASNATNATNVFITNLTSSFGGPFYPMFTATNNGNGGALVDNNLFLYAPTTNTLTVTSSFAISASWAPSVASNPFPFTGSAIISGSLVITGSLQVGVPGANNPAIDSTVGTLSRGSVISVDWINKNLIDASTVTSVDWENRVLYDTSAVTSVDWTNRILYEPSGYESLNYSNDVHVDSQLYYRNVIPSQVQRSIANTPAYGGQVIQASVDAGVTNYDLVSLDTDGVWKGVKAAVGYGADKMLGICVDNTGYVLIEGDVGVADDDSQGAYVVGADHGLPVYVSAITSEMTTTAPSGTGAIVRVVGHIYYQSPSDPNWWTMKFRPSNDWYEI